LFKSPTCVRSPRTVEILREVLSEKSLRYEDVVVERDATKDDSTLEPLLAMDLMGTPVIRGGSKIVKDYETTNEVLVREFLKEVGL